MRNEKYFFFEELNKRTISVLSTNYKTDQKDLHGVVSSAVFLMQPWVIHILYFASAVGKSNSTLYKCNNTITISAFENNNSYIFYM